jgi:hypothetical protein
VAMLHACSFPGCETLTLGERCLEHELPFAVQAWPRGRPFPRPETPAAFARWEPETAAPDEPELAHVAGRA